ncbi:MAG: hypothetical protein HY013_05280, partial [Candidatus Solibacter usitatus]|nr:hypothetical protein [Candidatus Solibacter usitatus]
MPTVYQHKELATTETPVLLFECQLTNGQVERWSTHRVVVSGQTYEPRVVGHNLFEMQTASDQGVDAIPKMSVTLANADSHFSQIERTVGFKGALVAIRFLFYDLKNNAEATNVAAMFQGIANPPEEITESRFRLTAVNRMSLQRVLLPEVRVQRRCPWNFPATLAERTEAVDGGAQGRYSRFYRCGYSADVAGGAGNLNGTTPYTSCSFTRADCEARGMFSQGRRFGGIEFVPASILVRTHGEKEPHASPVAENEARYNDFVPIIYGTAWHTPPIVFARNDGNLTRLEALIGIGEIQGVLKVLVNDIEIPLGQAGANMTGTGWFNVVSLGNRTGGFNLDFADAVGNPLGDPYGSLAYLSVVVPNRISDGRALPSIKALVEGLKLPRYAADGSALGDQFTNNPAWVLLDVLRRSGWRTGEIDLASFAQAAAYCDAPIAAQDLYGNPATVARFQCNVVLKKRRTAADAIRGIRNGSRLQLTYGAGGLLQLRVEDTLALQQPVKPAWSNSTSLLNGGWPSYEYGDGQILRRENGEPSVRLRSRTTTDTPNRFAVEFQDAFNEYQQDSLSVVDAADVARTGQEITGPLSVLGIPNFSQAARMLQFHLDRSIQGNTYVEFETSVRAIGMQPGDLIAVTYLKEGFNRQAFRVLRIAPGLNFRTAAVTAQIHKDTWYSDTNGAASGGRREGNPGLGLPRPLIGTTLDANGDLQFAVTEKPHGEADGGATVDAVVEFITPPAGVSASAGIPLLSLTPAIGGGGALAGNQTVYYAVSGVDGGGAESLLSFVVRATIAAGGNTNSVTLGGLSFSPGTSGFHVYRGPSPSQLFRIASNQTPAAQFTDTGLARQPVAPPDPNYHHANFYWRLELQTEYAATLHTPLSAGNGTMQMPVNAYRGMTARITRGKGAGQERAVVSNTATVLTLANRWDVEPDASSSFVVAESGWHFGAAGASSPVQFEIPNRTGAVIHLSGRAANANDKETPSEISTLTRWVIGGAGAGGFDADVPPQPSFGLALPPALGGVVEIGGISFPTLTNTRSITAATVTLYYWDELGGQPQTQLSAGIGAADTALTLAGGTVAAGSYIQIEREILKVTAAGAQYQVERAQHGSTAAAHAAQTTVYPL